jgi:hypothetical protein
MQITDTALCAVNDIKFNVVQKFTQTTHEHSHMTSQIISEFTDTN